MSIRVIIAPAKKMRVDTDSLPVRGMPGFLPEARVLLAVLRGMAPAELKALWRCNDSIAAENIGRVARMDLENGLTPAILAYDGIQYRYMAPGVMTAGQLDYLQEHLRILSGFYGMLRPFDGVAPYRLEMQAKLAVGNHKDLYAFWGGKLAAALDTDTVIDLASKEYSRAVLPRLPDSVRVVECVFAQEVGGKLKEKATLCKMARGQMVRWMAENSVSAPEDIRGFRDLGYRFSARDSGWDSSGGKFVFIKED